jgi:hypothetical protein
VAGRENLDRLDAAIGAWNRGDLDTYLELYDEGITLHGYGPAPMGKDEVRGTRCGASTR